MPVTTETSAGATSVRPLRVEVLRCAAGLRAYPNVTYFHQADRGGHVAAWEEPQRFTEEIRAAFRALR